MSRAAHSLLTHRVISRVAPALLAVALTPIGQAVAQIPSVAPTAPRAGEMLREVPVAPTMPALPSAAPVADASSATPQAPVAAFVFRELRLSGNTVLTPFHISHVTDPYIGKPMDEKALGALMAALRKRYEDKGYTLVSLGFPSQDLSQGSVTIDVVEPRLGRVDVPMGADAPITRDRIQGLMSYFSLRQGEVLSTAALERVMFALNDMPGVQAKAALSPAGDEGAYNVSIQVRPRRAWDASITLDNQGSSSAGKYRVSTLGRLNNPLGLGDNLDVQALLSSGGGVKVGRVAYELPVGYTPARLSVAYAQVAYSIGGEFEALDPHGTARVVETNLSYPILRSRTRTLMARIGAEQKNLTDKLYFAPSDESLRDDKRLHGVSAGLNYESRDNFLGGGFNGASAIFRWGQLRFKSEEGRLWDESLGTYTTGGRFGKAELQVSRLQAVVPRVTAFASLSQQHADRNLDAVEKMTLGGPRGVRAYPTAEGASDEATLLNTELRYAINPNWTVFALYDWAKGQRFRNVDPVDEPDNEIYLRAAGLGLSANVPGWASLRATVAWRGKQRSETDTSNDKMRLFVQAQHAF
jgi:hemolysin activation/secretion protein